MTDSTRDEAREQTELAVDSNQDPKEKPHGMPLTLASGGYGGDPCTGPEAERRGECPEGKPDGESANRTAEPEDTAK